MLRSTLLILAVCIVNLSGTHHAAAQFTIKIPKIPKAEKPNQTSSAKTEPAETEMSTPPKTIGDGQPTIVKDSIQVRAFTFSEYRKNSGMWSWVPDIKYSVNGPLESGSQLYVEFSIPGTGPWVKLDCRTDSTQAGFSSKTECGGRQIPEDKGSIHTGTVNFTIKMRNELAGSDMTLFSGKMKVAKVRSNETAAGTEKHFVYYVDHDWNLPIAYLFYEGDYRFEADRPERWAKPKFSIAFWMRGETNGFAEPHLFFGGKEVGKAFYNGGEVGKPDCSVEEVENNTTHITEPNGQFNWSRMKCTFNNVIPWNKSRDSNETMFGRLFLFSENPGPYELKILHNGRLIRTLKFAVDAQGKLVDNGIATTNKLGSDRVIVPVQVLGDQDGPWDRNAWRTDAFYGNPVAGFSFP